MYREEDNVAKNNNDGTGGVDFEGVGLQKGRGSLGREEAGTKEEGNSRNK